MNDVNRILLKITVRGRVQGVGYRWNTVREANSLGIKGLVRNMTDGSVYIEAEGSREILEIFLDWCKTGPSHAHVVTVEVESSLPKGYSEFSIAG